MIICYEKRLLSRLQLQKALYRKRLYFFSLCSEEQQKTHKDFLSYESFIIAICTKAQLL